jgi:hypothetical protein
MKNEENEIIGVSKQRRNENASAAGAERQHKRKYEMKCRNIGAGENCKEIWRAAKISAMAAW